MKLDVFLGYIHHILSFSINSPIVIQKTTWWNNTIAYNYKFGNSRPYTYAGSVSNSFSSYIYETSLIEISNKLYKVKPYVFYQTYITLDMDILEYILSAPNGEIKFYNIGKDKIYGIFIQGFDKVYYAEHKNLHIALYRAVYCVSGERQIDAEEWEGVGI